MLTRHQSIMEINYHTHQYHKIANDCWNNSLPTPVVKLFYNHPEEDACRNRQCQNNRTPTEEHHQFENDNKCSENIAQLGYQVSQTIQLFIQWSTNTIIYLGSLKNFTIFRFITNSQDFEDTMTFHYLCSTHHMVRRKCCILIKLLFMNCLMANRLACQRRLINIQGNRL